MATPTQNPEPVAGASNESPSDLSTVSENVTVESSGARIVDEKEVPHVVTEKLDEAWKVSSIPEPKQYFCLDANLLDAAITAVKARLEDKDSNVRGAWLLTEIDHWDLEKERLILLSDNNIISVKYNFILGQIEELKFIPVPYISELLFGDFKYPSSYVFSRIAKGLKVTWGKKEAPVRFIDRWNPFSSKVPSATFASHVLVRRKKMIDPRLTVESAVPEIEKAIVDFWKQNGRIQETSDGNTQRAGDDFRVTGGEIVVGHLVGLTALVHNESSLGFFKRRGAVNW
ncbi:tumor protein p63-regulated gene 1-like protein [Halichondria panicea]|uniref:tumor protein p63-regulated gene 1-like protein n=1 Tax=Halichondria panicea TaxID=6063 RepID=UPI00312B87BA